MAVKRHQPTSRIGICSFVWGGTWGALPEHLQNDLQQATGGHVSDQTVRNTLHKGGMMAWCPLVEPVLTTQHHAAWLGFARKHQNWQFHHWRPTLFTDESRFTLRTCDRCERDWRPMVKIMLPLTSSTMTGLAMGHWWSGQAYPGSHRHVIANGTLTAVRYRDEILRQLSDLMLVQCALGSSWCRTMSSV